MNHSTSSKKQQGTSIIEAVIALILVAIISSGAVFLSARASDAQGSIRVQEIAITQLRSALINNGNGGVDICSVAPTIRLPNNVTLTGPDDVQVQGCGGTIIATIEGVSVTVPEPLRISLCPPSATPSSACDGELLGGQIVVGGAWKNVP